MCLQKREKTTFFVTVLVTLEIVNTRSTKELNAFFAFGKSLLTSATLAVAVVVVVATAPAIKHPHGVQSG